MRRKPGTLLELEIGILGVAMRALQEGDGEFHGYQAARLLKEEENARALTGHGTLYKALDRLRMAGLLEGRWEDPESAAAEERPRRRLYRITAEGARAYETALRPAPATPTSPQAAPA